MQGAVTSAVCPDRPSRNAGGKFSERDVTVVIVTYNSQDVILRCLAALGDASIMIVDNASGDGTTAACSAARPDALIVENPQNLGFGRACNVGISKATTRFVLFLNPDALLQAGCLSALLRAAEQFPDAAMWGPALVGPQGQAVTSHDSSRLNRRSAARHGVPAFPDGPCCVDFLLGAAILARADVLVALGGFDESLFLFYEDDDLCKRVRDAGYSIIFTPAAKAMHLWGYSTPPSSGLSEMKAWHLSWSRLYVLEKHAGRKPMRREALERVIYFSCRAVASVCSFDAAQARINLARVRGILAYLTNRRSFRGKE